MCETSADSRPAVAEALRGSRRLLLTTHVRPDGDALGSLAALHRSAGAAGKDCRSFVPDAVPRRYAFLLEGLAPPAETGEGRASTAVRRDAPAGVRRDAAQPPPGEQGLPRFAELADAADRIVVLDTSSARQLEPIAAVLADRREKLLVVDHHVTADDIAAVAWRDPTAAAAGVMVLELLEDLGWPIDAPAAGALLAAVCADTGWLRFSSTDARAASAVARLIRSGARTDELYARICQADRPQRLRLLAAALASLELHADGRLAVTTLTRDAFARTDAVEDETEDFVNEPLRIASVEVSAILIDRPEGGSRVSLRSRPARGAPGRPPVDVAELARRFGGGGHVQAAGYRTDLPTGQAKAALLQALAESGLA